MTKFEQLQESVKKAEMQAEQIKGQAKTALDEYRQAQIVPVSVLFQIMDERSANRRGSPRHLDEMSKADVRGLIDEAISRQES